MSRQCIILAGGLGTRLKDRLGDLPKPMIPIGGRPLLEHQVELARQHGFEDILLFVHYRADLIKKHFGDGSGHGCRIIYREETEPRGTAGAVLDGLDGLEERCVVFYGDTMVNLDLNRLWDAHAARGAAATLVLHPNDHPLDSDLVETDAESWITAFHNRPHREEEWRQNLVNAGLYVLEKRPLREWFQESGAVPAAGKILDFGRDFFPALLARGERLLGYNTPEYIKDIGTPERYDRICLEYAAGVIQRSSLAVPQRAVFLDRDGTLVVDKDCLRTADDLELLPGAAAALRELNHHGWRTVLVTNQPVVAKGWCTEAEVDRMHRKLETLLGREGAFLDRIYYCPHHPESGFEGERRDLKVACDCRKPAKGMMEAARKDLHIEVSQSWLVGDTTTDMQAARNAGLRGVLVGTGAGGKDGKYKAVGEYEADNILDAVRHILETTET